MLSLHRVLFDAYSKDADVSIFESLYRSNIIARYENINLLGATSLTRDETKYPLEIGYVSLELIGKNQTSTISIKNILKNRKNIWIIGEAGSGKSTLLQWIAINCARSNFTLIGEASNCIPILIELKNVNAGSPSLNDAIKNIMRDEGYSTPAKWLTSILKSGKAILLFDGVDEVKKEDRGKILSWIEELRGKYNEIRIVVTSRPQVEERIQENNIAEISVLPMQPKKIDEFIDYWHKAVLENKLHLKSDDIEICKEKLKKCLIKNEAVRNISSNPGMSRKMCK